MLIRPNQSLFGVSAKLMQLAAYALGEEFDLESLCWELGAPPAEVQPVVDQLVGAEWLVPDAKKPEHYIGTMPWRQLRLARVGKPLPRVKADTLVADMLARVKAANRVASVRVPLIVEIHVFGSYLNPEITELGDVDVAFALGYADEPFELEDFTLRGMYSRDTAAAKIIKNRSQYMGLCPADQLEVLGCKSLLIYSVKDDDELWGPAYTTAQVFGKVHQKVLAGEPVYESWRKRIN
jgi:hypothetical protein